MTSWNNYDYELSLCRNYRALKNFVENEATPSWPFFPIRTDYLDKIKFFSIIDLKEYHPNLDLNEFLEKNDEPFPVYHKHFFSHLPIQLTFFKFNRIDNLLDYHFKTFTDYFPQKEVIFIKSVEHQVAHVVEHNAIKDFNPRVEKILRWARNKYLHLETLEKGEIHIEKFLKNFLDLSITNINNAYKKYLINQERQAPKKSAPKHANLSDPGLVITIKESLKEEMTTLIYDKVESDLTDIDAQKFTIWFSQAEKGKTKNKYVIKKGAITKLCRLFVNFYDVKKAFPGVQKIDLANWIVNNFQKRTSKKGISQLSFKTIYNILKGSK